MKKVWRCKVCGYLHEGEAPPEFCPVCHAAASQFELVEEVASQHPAAAEAAERGLLQEMRETFVPHAVFAHFPNALIPTALLFLLLALIFSLESFEQSAFYLLLVGLLAVPPTFVSGLFDWQKKFAGEKAPIFVKKILLAAGLLVLLSTAIIWRWLDPQVLADGGWPAGLYFILVVAMLACVTLLGHYGGVLVFGRLRSKIAEK